MHRGAVEIADPDSGCELVEVSRETRALVGVTDDVADARLERGQQHREQSDSALAELGGARLVAVEEQRRGHRSAANFYSQSHRIENPIRDEEIVVNLALPEAAEVASVQEPPVPDFGAECVAALPADVYLLVVVDVSIECRLGIVLAVEQRDSRYLELERGAVGAEQVAEGAAHFAAPRFGV